MDRRTFLTALGAGTLVVAVPVPALAGARSAEWVPSVYLRLDSGGAVTVTVPRPDTGQGVRTVVAMLVAEELAVDLTAIDVEQAEGDTAKYGQQMVANSLSVRALENPVRQAAATARALLVAAAARRWGVPAAQCRARDGEVRHPRRGRLPYAALVGEAAAIDPGTVEVELTPRARWRVLGGGAGRVDARDIVTGRARYGIDTAPPGVLTAVLARPPWIGATVASFDDTAATAVPGVVAVAAIGPRTGAQGGVAVIATATGAALRGREALTVQWTGGAPTADSRRWLDDLAARLPEPEDLGPSVVQAEYRLPMLAHAPMEPMNATAHWRPDGLDVWAPTQDPGGLRTLLSRLFAVPESTVAVHATLSGGAFGRRIEPDFVSEAVECSRVAGRPVKVLWTRAEDTQHDSYRPLSVHRMRAVVGRDGIPVRRAHDVATWPLSVAPFFNNPDLVLASGDHFPYTVEGRARVALSPSPLRTGFWRSVYAGPFVFAEEAFLSSLADTARIGQVALRRRLLPTGGRLRRVLDVAAARSRPRSGRLHEGVACHLDYGSAIAVIAHAERTRTGPRLRRVTAAVDVGAALHPSGVRAQVEGGVVDALSTVLGAQITVREGRVAQSSFADYGWARIDDVPPIDVHIVETDHPVGGLGELAYPPATAAIACALARAGRTTLTGLPALGVPG
ncbi:molybdopterin cofactor-binding domain-containing protein [Actinokineospora guangxiensis]|uniref:Molybdopterin cofactor-binding domain-containing protein n=1 Tax=Actinokineospora guangxiensis TaxID=1490288 RepID=A0ABW0ET74_9PSEU